MKIRVKREPFVHAFQTAAMVVPTRTTKEILKNVKLTLEEGVGLLVATDMEVGIRIEFPHLEVEQEGTAVTPVGELGTLLRESADEQIEIETRETTLYVRGSHSEFELPLAAPEEFPSVPGFGDESYYELKAGLFRELIRRTLFATDPESSRYALGGVLLEFDKDHVTAVATDGRRLAKMEGTVQCIGEVPGEAVQMIVPNRAMQLMERSISDVESTIQVAGHGNDVLVRNGPVTIYARLVEGRFPRWRDILPKRDDSVRIELPVGPLFTALRQAAVVTDKESRGVIFDFGQGTLVLSANSREHGRGRIELPISHSGAGASVSMDHRYVGEFLRVLEAEKNIVVDVKDSKAAALFETDDGYTYVVMPMAKKTN